MMKLTNILDKSLIKGIVQEAFGEGINVNEMLYFTAVDLAEILVSINNVKEEKCKTVREHPELTGIILRSFRNYIKNEAMGFNYKYEQNIKFSGLLGRYMREIKNASVLEAAN
jgi:hypothetical protein